MPSILFATNTVIGILCLTAFAQVFSLATGKLFLYTSIFLALPWLVRYVTHKIKSKQELILCLNLNFILFSCGLVFRFPVLEDYPLIPVLLGYFSVLGVCLFINSSKNMENIFEKINVYLKIPALLFFIWVAVWAGTPRLNHPLHVPQWSTVIYMGFCLVISYFVKFKYARLSWIVYILPFFFIDSELHYDAYHYDAYIEAANAVLMGGVPLDNVFCQYGLGYLIYSLGFLVLPHTYVSAALITNIANAIMTCFYLLCLRRLVKKTDIFCYFGMLSVFFFMLYRVYLWGGYLLYTRYDFFRIGFFCMPCYRTKNGYYALPA